MGAFKAFLGRLKSPGAPDDAATVEVQDQPQQQNDEPSPYSTPLGTPTCQLSSNDPQQLALGLDDLWGATCGTDAAGTCDMLYAAGLVPRLVELLSSCDHKVQVSAAGTLGNILGHLHVACTQAAAAGAVPVLIQLISSEPYDMRLQRFAVGALESIIDHAEQSTISMRPAVGPLVKLLSRDDIRTQSRAAGCLWSVVRHDEEGREEALAAGAAERLAELLQCAAAIHDMPLLHRALMVFGTLSPHPDVKRALLEGGCIPLLVDLLTTAPQPEQQQLSLGLLYNIVALDTPMAEAVVVTHPAPSLVSLLTSDQQQLQRVAVALLELLADQVAAFREDVLAAGAVPILVQLVKSCEDGKTQEKAAGLLWTMCADTAARPAIREAGGVQALERLRCDREDPDVIKMATGALKALQQAPEQDQAAVGCQEGAVSSTAGETGQVSVEQRVAELSSTEVAVRRTALGDLTNLTGADATSSLLLRTQGVVPIVVRLLRDTDDEVTQLAAALLGNMLSDDAEVSSEQAVAEGAVEPLMTMLERPADPLAQRYAAGALCVIAGCRVETRPLLRRSAVQPLVVLLSSGDTCTQRRACTCLAALLQHDMPTLVAMRKAGGVPPLVAQLSSSEESVMERAAAVLGNVLADDILSRALAVEAGAVQVLVNLLSHDREDVQRYAAGCLMCILETSGKGQMAALKAGAVERLTHLAEAHSDSEAGKRARAALGYLKESW